jgi:hypothetical protein
MGSYARENIAKLLASLLRTCLLVKMECHTCVIDTHHGTRDQATPELRIEHMGHLCEHTSACCWGEVDFHPLSLTTYPHIFFPPFSAIHSSNAQILKMTLWLALSCRLICLHVLLPLINARA